MRRKSKKILAVVIMSLLCALNLQSAKAETKLSIADEYYIKTRFMVSNCCGKWNGYYMNMSKDGKEICFYYNIENSNEYENVLRQCGDDEKLLQKWGNEYSKIIKQFTDNTESTFEYAGDIIKSNKDMFIASSNLRGNYGHITIHVINWETKVTLKSLTL